MLVLGVFLSKIGDASGDTLPWWCEARCRDRNRAILGGTGHAMLGIKPRAMNMSGLCSTT